jgi:hypothetical protein
LPSRRYYKYSAKSPRRGIGEMARDRGTIGRMRRFWSICCWWRSAAPGTPCRQANTSRRGRSRLDRPMTISSDRPWSRWQPDPSGRLQCLCSGLRPRIGGSNSRKVLPLRGAAADEHFGSLYRPHWVVVSGILRCNQSTSRKTSHEVRSQAASVKGGGNARCSL